MWHTSAPSGLARIGEPLERSIEDPELDEAWVQDVGPALQALSCIREMVSTRKADAESVRCRYEGGGEMLSTVTEWRARKAT